MEDEDPEEFVRRAVAKMTAEGWLPAEKAAEYVRVPDHVLAPIVADLVSTLGWSPRRAKTFVIENSPLHWEAGVSRLVVTAEGVQQRLHDDRIDTTWPACPEHPHQPLWLSRTSQPSWTCPIGGKALARLG